VTLLDTNIVIDLLSEAAHEDVDWSRRCYADALAAGPVLYNHVVMAEVAAGAARPDDLSYDLDRLHIELVPLSTETAIAAGLAFREYRRRGGAREAILADFLIAGHAAAIGATLVTRDRRLARYFPDLTLITPETHP
jgi:predicted nucleic acid-binding protein